MYCLAYSTKAKRDSLPAEGLQLCVTTQISLCILPDEDLSVLLCPGAHFAMSFWDHCSERTPVGSKHLLWSLYRICMLRALRCLTVLMPTWVMVVLN